MPLAVLGQTPDPWAPKPRPGEAKPGEDVTRTRTTPAPFKGTSGKDPPGAGYGVFRPNQGPSGTWHWGIDIAAPITQPVVAPEAMSVVAVWTDNDTPPFAGYGPAGVLAKGDSGVYHLLAHLDPTAWSDDNRPTKGQRFDMGEQVGFPAPTGMVGVGATPHVHWEVRVQPVDNPSTRGANTLDPVAWKNGVALPKGEAPNDIPWWLVLGILYLISRK